ncbi:MAG: fatty acid desaturase family protein [Actinomycetota bacterium]
MTIDTPAPEELEAVLVQKADREVESVGQTTRSEQVRAENLVANQHWGGIEWRIIATFLFFSVCWGGVLYLGVTSAIPLWLGLVLNTVFASTFYMPEHEATHRNIWGVTSRGRRIEDAIGVLCSIPTGIEFTSHRAGHMRHHAFTNDPDRDPDHFTEGRLRELPVKFYGATMLTVLLPVFALVPPVRVLLPTLLRAKLVSREGNKSEGKAQLRYWLLTTIVLVVCFITGNGLAALCLWWLPARLQFGWLMFIFAWYPHHPARETSRYRHTRVAVFPGSGLLIRGHDYHAIHHLYPRVPHYRLKAVWNELSDDLVQRGVRAEGRAKSATTAVVW